MNGMSDTFIIAMKETKENAKSFGEVRSGDRIFIFNRRVGGWDGSPERPVVEFLGAGGHVPSI